MSVLTSSALRICVLTPNRKLSGRSCLLRTLPCLVAWLVLGLGFCSLNANAQSAATLEAFTKEAHVGSTLEALVGVVVSNKAADGSVQTRYGNGLLLRCDGFVLVPAEMFNTRNVAGAAPAVPDQTVAIYLHPGTDQEKRVKARRPNWYGFIDVGEQRYRLGYAVLKLDNVHAPAGRTLLPDCLATGDALRVAWSSWDTTKARFKPVEMRDVTVGTRKQPDPKDKTPELFRLQTTPFAKPLEAVPPGALVLGPEELAVGMVTPKRAEDVAEFSNFTSLHLATNCVTPFACSDATFMKRVAYGTLSVVPARGDNEALPVFDGNGSKTETLPATTAKQTDRQKDKQTAKKVEVFSEEMVQVPGGPVRLPKALLDLQLDMESSTVACVAPFLIDRYEVTNAQYLQFWKSLPAQTRRSSAVQADLYPASWGQEERPFPMELDQVPVLGVRLPGARAYAKWAGKRLPTPYEWCLAAFGPSGGNTMPDWVKRFLQQRKQVWDKVVDAHQAYVRQHPELVPLFDIQQRQVPIGNTSFPQPVTTLANNGKSYYSLDPNPDHPGIPELFRLPWYFYSADYQDAAEWSKQTVLSLTEPLFSEWIDPMYILPVGSRAFDISPYGAQDMLLNARELVVPGPFYPWNRPPNPNWPVREIDRYIHIDFTMSELSALVYRTVRSQVDLGAGLPPIDTTVSPESLHDPASVLQMLQGLTFLDHDAIFGTGNPGLTALQGGTLNVTSTTVTNDPETRFGNYTDTMLSRRIRSAYENERAIPLPLGATVPIASRIAPALEPYLTVRAALTEVSELLRPADQAEVSLKAGPTRDIVQSLGGGVTRLRWSLNAKVNVTVTRQPNGKVTFNRQIDDSDWVAVPEFFPTPPITQTASFSLWNELPRHYHNEIGRIPNKTPQPGNAPIAATSNNMPDTYVVGGGFRCVR